MPATTTPDAPANQPEQSHRAGGPRRHRSPLSIVLWTLLALFAAATVLAVVLVAAGGETETSAPEAAVEPIVERGTAGLVADFAQAWSDGDWETLVQLSDQAVAQTAREWHVDGLQVTVVAPLSDTGGTLLVSDPAGGNALIFAITVTDDPGLRVTDLVFNGDAG